MADAQPDPPSSAPNYAQILGQRLLEQGLLLVFDAASGALQHANEAAIFLLEMSEDGLSEYDFQALCDVDGEEASDLWFELVAGARPEWKGSLKAVLSGTGTPVNFIAALGGEDGDEQQVILHGKKIDTVAQVANDAGMFGGLNDYIGVIEMDAEGRVVGANERAEMALEYFSGDLVGKRHDNLWPQDEANKPSYVEFWEKLRQGRIVEGCYRHQTGEGSEIWLQCTYVPIRSDDGMLQMVKQCIMDVTDATFVAVTNKAMLDAIYSVLNVAEFDKDGHYVEASDPMIDLLGTTRGSSFNGREYKRFLEKEFQRDEGFQRAWKTSFEGTAASADVLHVRDDGKPIWTFSHFAPVKKADGTLDKVIEVAFDINETRNELRDLRLRYDMIDKTVGLVEIGSNGRVIAANQRYLDDLGMLETDVVDREYVNLVPHELQHTNDFRDFWDGLLAGNSDTGHYRRVGANGAEIWFRSVYAPLMYPGDRRVRRLLCVSHNVTEEKRRDSENQGKLKAFENLVSTAEYTPDGKLVDASDGFLRILGYQLEEVKECDHSMFCPPEFSQGDGYSVLWQRLRGGGNHFHRRSPHHQLGGGVLACPHVCTAERSVWPGAEGRRICARCYGPPGGRTGP